MRSSVALGIAGVVLVAVLGVVYLVVPHAPEGAGSPESVVADYVAALRDNDRDRLEDIADPGHDASTEITDRLRRLGGGKLTVTGTAIGTTESDSQRPVDIVGTTGGAPFSEQLWLFRRDDRWFIALGPVRSSRS